MTLVYGVRSDSIHSITYSGGDERTILSFNAMIRHPFAVVIYGDHVYWTDWFVTKVLQANKWNGTQVKSIQTTGTQPYDVKIIHPTRQPKGNNQAVSCPGINSNMIAPLLMHNFLNLLLVGRTSLLKVLIKKTFAG